MKCFFSGLVMMVLVIGFSSCQREVDGFLPEEEEILNDNIYISKLVELDTSFASGLDTAFVDTFYYDTQKRLIKVVETTYESGTHNVEGIFTHERFYNGSDTVPYKVAVGEIYPLTSEVYRDTSFFFLNSSKQIIKDSVVSYESSIPRFKRVEHYYSEGAGSYYVRRIFYDFNTGTINSDDSVRMSRIFTASNLVSCTDSTFRGGTNFLSYVYRYTASYDNKKSPFIKLSLPYLALQIFGSTALGESTLQFSSINNPQNVTLYGWTGGPINTSAKELRYEYNVNNYPSIIRYFSMAAPDTYKKLLFYRTL